MTPIKFEESNRILGAPQGMEGDVIPLAVFTNGEECISCWQPSEEEKQMIAGGSPVFLRIWSGQTQPPIALSVVSPFAHTEFRHKDTQELIDNLLSGEIPFTVWTVSNTTKIIDVTNDEFEYIVRACSGIDTQHKLDEIREDFDHLFLSTKQYGIIHIRKTLKDV